MKRRLIILLFFVSLLNFSQPKLDSLLNLNGNQSDTALVKELADLCWEYRSINPKAAIKFGLAAVKRAELISNEYTKSEILNYLGVIYGNISMLDSAFYFYNQAFQLSEQLKDSTQIAYSLNNIGDYYYKTALYSIALEKIIRAYEIFEKIKDKRGMAYTLNDIGEIYMTQQDLNKANTYFLRSGNLRLELNDQRGYAKSLINQAAVFQNQGLDSNALEFYSKSLQLSRESDYIKGESWSLSGLADVYLKQGLTAKALRNRLDALEIDKKIGNKYGELINYNQLGLIFMSKGELDNAQYYFTKAMKESSTTGHLDQLMTSYDYLRQLSLKKSDYRNAYEYLDDYRSLKDSIFSHENLNRIADLQTAFYTERKERENEILKKDVEYQKATRNYVFLIALLILGAVLLFVSKYRYEKKVNSELNHVNKKLYELNVQKDKIFSIVGHDLKNPAGAISNFLEVMHLEYDQMDDFERKEFIRYSFESSRKLINLLIELLEWGKLARGLVEVELKELELQKIVDELLELLGPNAIQKRIKLISKNCDTKIFGDKAMFNTVLRNFVNNAIKFTPEGGEIIISHKDDENYHYISTKDTGVGIKLKNYQDLFRMDISTTTRGTANESGSGIGLPICKEFVEKCGGTILVESEIGVGSNFTIKLPKEKFQLANVEDEMEVYQN